MKKFLRTNKGSVALSLAFAFILLLAVSKTVQGFWMAFLVLLVTASPFALMIGAIYRFAINQPI